MLVSIVYGNKTNFYILTLYPEILLNSFISSNNFFCSSSNFFCTLIKMTKMKKMDYNKCCQGCGGSGIFVHYCQGYKMLQLLWKTPWLFPKKLYIHIPCDPDIPLLHIYHREIKVSIHTKTYTGVFIAAWFVTAKNWEQPKCLSTGEWINQLWDIHIMEYSALKRNELFTDTHQQGWISK